MGYSSVGLDKLYKTDRMRPLRSEGKISSSSNTRITPADLTDYVPIAVAENKFKIY